MLVSSIAANQIIRAHSLCCSEVKEPDVSASLPFVTPPPGDRSSPWRVIAGGERTGGAVSFGDARIPLGSPGPGRYVHTHEDEAIYVVEGILTVEVGGDRFEAEPQTLVWLPRRVPHVFANLTDEEVWTVGIITPAGLEEFFREQAGYFASLTGPPDNDVLVAMSARYGVLPVEGPPLE
jgi:mannose-6-phosphate isomerase-like protein (cupin superfamily)